MVSRAPSIRSVRSTHTLPRVPSIEPTLPAGAERMLNQLRPNQDDHDEAETEAEVDHHPYASNSQQIERPQFVLGAEDHDEEDEKEVRTTHRPVTSLAPALDYSNGNKGWKEVA